MEWSERIRVWRESGLSGDAFAKSVGCRSKTLQWWASELARRARGAKEAPPKVAMARVQVAPSPATLDQPDAIAIVVGRAQIAVRRGFDRKSSPSHVVRGTPVPGRVSAWTTTERSLRAELARAGGVAKGRGAGYPEHLRSRVTAFARAHGVKRAVSSLGVSPGTVRKWMRDGGAFLPVVVARDVPSTRPADHRVVLVSPTGWRARDRSRPTPGSPRSDRVNELLTGRRVFVHREPVDMRKAFDGLTGLVVNAMKRDLLDVFVFVFVGRDRKRAKALVWDGTGICLFAKRVAKGRFAAPWEVGGDGELSPGPGSSRGRAQPGRRRCARGRRLDRLGPTRRAGVRRHACRRSGGASCPPVTS